MTDGRQSHSTYSVTLQPNLAEVAAGRRFLAQISAEAGFPDDRVFDITVACSEAMANAIEHSPVKGAVVVRAAVYNDRLEVEIEGPGEFQTPDRLKERNTRGLGLPLMAKLSDHLALFSGPAGQTLVSLTFYKPDAHTKGAGALPPSFANLSEENRLLDDVLRHLPDGFYVLDDDWRFIYANPAALSTSGLPEHDVMGTVMWEVFPATPPAARRGLEVVSAERSATRVVASTAEGRWWEYTAFPVDEGVAVYSRDITESTAAEDRLKRQARLLDLSSDAIFAWEWDGPIFYWNSGAEALYGFSAEEAIGRVSHQLLATEFPEGFATFRATMEQDRKREGELWHTTKDGRSVVVESRQQLVGDGRLVVLETNRNTTDRKAAEEERERLLVEERALVEELAASNEELASTNEELAAANQEFAAVNEELLSQTEELAQRESELRDSNERLQMLAGIVENASQPIAVGYPDGSLGEFNQAFADLLGYARDELAALDWSAQLTPLEWCDLEAHKLAQLQTAGGSVRYEKEYLHQDGTRIPVELLVQLARDAAGKPLYYFWFVTDLTERRRAEKALEFQAELLANVQDPMTGTDEHFVITYWNEAAERVFGWKAEEVIGRRAGDVLKTRLQGRTREEGVAELFSTGMFRDTVTYMRKDGGEIHADVSTALLRHPDGTVKGTISVQRDVTERWKMEQALRSSEKRTRLLLQVADAVAEWTDLGKVLDASLQAVVDATAHTRASIGLLDQRGTRIQVAASAGAEPMEPASAPLIAFSQGLQDALITGGTVLVDYDRLPPEQRQVADTYHTRHSLVAPLVYHDKVTGVILVDDPGEWKPFTAEEQDLIQGIAAQAAIAIENARLYEAQKNIADQLQLTILDLPLKVAGLEFSHLYHSATEEAIVGGDFYDVFERPDGSIILLAGDVSGHGVNAARVATMVKASLVAFAQSGDAPGAVLEHANQLLMRKRVPGFTSVLFAAYEPSTGLLEYCSAGHPNLMLAHKDGTVEITGKNHLPLGVFPEWRCAVDSLQVKPGDTLLLYTDGLTEARVNGSFFGERRLAEVLSRRVGRELRDLPQALLDEALEFSNGRLQDDVAILAVRPVERD